MSSLYESGIIRKIGTEWCVLSGDGTKRLGCYKTKQEAVKRLRQVEYFADSSLAFYCEACRSFYYQASMPEDCPICHGGSPVQINLAAQECECGQCGHQFMSKKRCDQSRCPRCGEQDDINELTGLL
jgi:hypothetical protein